MQWGTWNGAHSFSWRPRDRALVTPSAPQLSKYSSRGCCHWCRLQSEGASSLWSLPPSRGLWSAKLTWSAGKSKANKFVRPRQVDRQMGHLFNHQAKSELNYPSVVDSRIVGFLSIKEPFLFETSLCLWESWGWVGPRCPWQNQGEGKIIFTPYSLLAWQIRRFHQGLEFSGSDARMELHWSKL